MYTVIRTYTGSGAKELFDLLEERKGDVEAVLRTVQGLASYALVKTDGGGFSVTVCQDKSGTDQSLQVAREWIEANASHLGTSPPTVSEGTAILHLT